MLNDASTTTLERPSSPVFRLGPPAAEPGFGDVSPRDLLANLTADERRLLDEVGCPRTFRRNAVVYNQGDPAGWTYIIKSGMVRTYRTSCDGREFTMGFWGERDIIGGPDIFSRAPRMLAAVTTQATVMSAFASDELDMLIARIPRFAHNLIAALSFKSRWIMNTTQEVGTRQVPQRVAQAILLQAEIHGTRTDAGFRVITHMSHQDLAQLVGASRPWVTRALSAFQGRGFLRVAHRSITVLDEQGLRELSRL